MANEPIQGLPYPLPSDTNDPPRDIKALADATVSRTNMRFATEGARDAAITSPVDGMEVFIGTGSSGLKQLRLNGAWIITESLQTVAVTPSKGTGTITATRRGILVEVFISVDLAEGFGIGWQTLGNVPVGFRPPGDRRGGGLMFSSDYSPTPGAISVAANGDIQIYTQNTAPVHVSASKVYFAA